MLWLSFHRRGWPSLGPGMTMLCTWFQEQSNDIFHFRAFSRRFCPKRLAVNSYIHSFTDGGGSHARCWPENQEQFGVQYQAQGHSDMQNRGIEPANFWQQDTGSTPELKPPNVLLNFNTYRPKTIFWVPDLLCSFCFSYPIIWLTRTLKQTENFKMCCFSIDLEFRLQEVNFFFKYLFN